MGFMRRLVGAARPTVQPPTAPWAQPAAPVVPRGESVSRSTHPNGDRSGVGSGGDPDRWAFEAPDWIVVLNAKMNSTAHAVRLIHTDPAQLAALAGPKGRELVPTELRSDGASIAVFRGDERIGHLPSSVAQRFAPLVRDHEARNWRLVTWTNVTSPEYSIAEDQSRSGTALIAEVRLPTPDEALFADAYDASFAFPRKQVFARRNTPEGKAEHDAAVASAPRHRETVLVRVGPLAVRASRCPWEDFGTGQVESRGLRLKDQFSIWLPLGEATDELAKLGARTVEVAGLTNHPDHDAPEFAAEQSVWLDPEPDNPHDPHAIAVRSADGCLRAGYLPRAAAAWCQRRGSKFSGLVIWEYRPVGDAHHRSGLRVLIAPVPLSIEPA